MLCRYISIHILSKLNRTLEEFIAFNLIDINFSTSIRKIANNEGYDFYELVNSLAEHSYQSFLARLDKYSPKYLITMGKPVFLFLSKKSGKNLEFKEVFATQIKIDLEGHSLICLPCVHMTTFNVYRRVYGEQDARLERLVKAWHEHNIKCLFHSDGNLMPVLADLVKTGIDGLNPIETAAGMNLKEVKNFYGDMVSKLELEPDIEFFRQNGALPFPLGEPVGNAIDGLAECCFG